MMDMYLKYFLAAWMVLLAGGLFSQQRFENRSGSTHSFEWRFLCEEQLVTESPIDNQWKLNLDYTTIELKRNFRCSFLTLNNLARAAESINEQDNQAFECLNSLLVKNQLDFKSLESGFEAITAQASGTVRWRSEADE
jgi:hypothetical protein